MADRPDAPDRDALLAMFEIQSRIKLCDERFRSLLTSGQIQLIYYSPRGQECISAGWGVHLRPDDYVVTIYRGLHDHLAKGVPLRELWAEFLGRATGTCKGKGGPMHITHPASGLMVTTGIVGSGIPIANGFGLAAQLSGTDQVTVVNFGDGASNIGSTLETMNLAAELHLRGTLEGGLPARVHLRKAETLLKAVVENAQGWEPELCRESVAAYCMAILKQYGPQRLAGVIGDGAANRTISPGMRQAFADAATEMRRRMQ